MNKNQNIQHRPMMYVKSVLISLLFTFTVLVIFSIVASYTNLEEKYLTAIINTANYIAMGLCGFLFSVKRMKNGAVIGLIGGIIYAVVIYVLGIVFFSSFSINPFNLLLGAILGMVGGIIGVNKKPVKKLNL